MRIGRPQEDRGRVRARAGPGPRASSTFGRSARRRRNCWRCETGWPGMASPTSRWRARGSPGNRSSICSRTRSRVCWPTPRRSRKCRGGRRTSGLRLDRATAGARARAGKLCATSADPRTRRSHTYRAALIGEHTRETNRLQKVLEDTGIKLASVASDVLRVSGRAMLDALTRGTRDPEVLADLAHGALRRKLPALRQPLAGRFRPQLASSPFRITV